MTEKVESSDFRPAFKRIVRFSSDSLFADLNLHRLAGRNSVGESRSGLRRGTPTKDSRRLQVGQSFGGAPQSQVFPGFSLFPRSKFFAQITE